MKKVLNIGIGGRSFVMDEDAYMKLDDYLEAFRGKVGMGYQTKEVMDDLEMRIADIFAQSLSVQGQVVNIELVNRVIAQLGMPDGSDCRQDNGNNAYGTGKSEPEKKKLFRDPDNKMLGGVCSGLAHYFDVEMGLVRVLMLLLLFLATGGFWLYIILWFVVPKANTPADKCRMHGLPVTAENMSRFRKQY